ncbi:hypothetical protein B9Z55_021647 [Caenorhabditis nigoni]|uniref:SGNH hydrolase-type esterase domain-containing protein n=2 Tax=Caenorhabditis nigoni TaxID=1611254 RepID=A0A2G5TTU2_9PELO|nr:hypothetical protein B9Z55_021647 [Caenorhabditis nigoni]
MLAFLYFVQMLINLPKMLVLSWNNVIFPPLDSSKIAFRITTVSEKFPELWQTPSDVSRRDSLLNISICHVEKFKFSKFEWKFDGQKFLGQECSQIFRIQDQKFHRVTVEIGDTVIEENLNLPPPRKFWIASIGDSFSSGQGNPGDKWLDESCYRSKLAFPVKLSEKIENSILSFLSCSGSTVEQGILSKNGQLEVLNSLIMSHGSPPNILFLTIGGNDIGFTDVISLVQRDSNIADKFDMRFFFVSHQIDRVAWKLREMNISRVVLLDYYDVTKNDENEVDASCGAFGQVSLSNLKLAEKKILQRLNQLLRRKAQEYGWITVDTSEIFGTRGICSNRSLIRSRNESLVLQGNEYGSFHPNEEAHQLIAMKILETLKEREILNN